MLCLIVLATVVTDAAPRSASAQQAPTPAPGSPSLQQAPAIPAPATPAQESAPPSQAPPAGRGVERGHARRRVDTVETGRRFGKDARPLGRDFGAGRPHIRVLAATSLGDMKARSAIPQLKNAMDDDSPEVSFAAAQALWKIGNRSGREILYAVLRGERKAKLGLVKGKMDKMRQQMHDPKSLALIGINEASGAFLGPFSMGVSFIEEYARNNSAPVQALCANLLSSDNSRDTVNELRDALADKNWAVRAAAARALAKLNHPEAIPQLRDMMQFDKEQPAPFAAAIIRLSPTKGNAPEAAPPPGASAVSAAEPAKK